MEHLFPGDPNTIHTITEDQLRELFLDNQREAEESQSITASSYRGENYYTQFEDQNFAFDLEYLLRDPKTSGMRMYYPHGIVIEQSARRNFYRGENQIYPSSIPSLLRTLRQYKTREEKELYRLISDMRIAEFSFLLKKFHHVQEWKDSDVLYEPLAQHYGLQTSWLDITSDFNTALFFATCRWDGERWLPLTKKETEVDENHRYGMIFHMPSNKMAMRWIMALEKLKPWTEEPIGKTEDGNDKYGKLDYPPYRGELQNIVYPLGFQPFMRCHMQNGYGIYMRTEQPLQMDPGFEKLRFRHSEKLSQKVYDLMQGGELVYPHEGLKSVQFLIDQIRDETKFSEPAFQYALYRNHYFGLKDADKVREKLEGFTVDGKKIEIIDRHPWKLSSGRRKKIDQIYEDFSLQNWYGIMILDRKQIPGPSPFFEPWMLPEREGDEGVMDFKLRESVNCGNCIASRNMVSLLSTLKYAKLSDF